MMIITRIGRARLATLALAGAVIALPGCLISSRSDQHITGNRVGTETFSRIEPGKTTMQWVQASMGEPSSKRTLDDGTEIWRWNYTKTKNSRGAVFLIASGDDSITTSGSTVVEIKDGLVIRAWQD